MWILAHFTRDGEPATGLSPIIEVRDVDTTSVVVSGSSMLEVGGGFYKYDFSLYNPDRDYAITCDSVTLSGTERYTYASSGEYNEVLDSIESTVGIVDIRTNLLRKIWTNRLELFDGDTDNWVLYDDDASTPLLTFSVSDKDGDLIIQQEHTPSKRSGADGTYSGTLSPDLYMKKSIYDPNDNGYVNAAEQVYDGTYNSTAYDIYQAVANTHPPEQLGTKFINESTISGGYFVRYNSTTNELEYYPILDVIDHGNLLGLGDDDHTQYILVSGTRSFTGEVGGVYPTQSGSLVTKKYVDDQINELRPTIQSKYGSADVVLGTSDTSVVFNGPFTDDNYALSVSLVNEIDSPSSEYGITVTSKTNTGFTVHYSGDIDSNNYVLDWHATYSGIGTTDCTNCLEELKDDTSPELGGDLFVGSNGIELDTTPSGNFIHGYTIGWSGDISTMRVDLNDTGFGCPLYMKSNGHWAQCTAASGSNQMPCAALALEEGTGLKKIIWKGIVRKGAWSWTPGTVLYASTVEGALTSSAPSNMGENVQAIGIALKSDTIRFDPGFNIGTINS